MIHLLKAIVIRVLAAVMVGLFATEAEAATSAGYALQFEGSNQAVGILGSALRIDNEFTFEAWVRITNYGSYTIISQDDPNGTALRYDFVFQIDPNGQLALYAANTLDTGVSAVPLNQWIHVAATYDGMAKRFYIDGGLDRSVPSQSVLGGLGISFATYIGRQGWAVFAISLKDKWMRCAFGHGRGLTRRLDLLQAPL